MQSGLSTSSYADGLRYEPFSFASFLRKYKKQTNAEQFSVLRFSDEAVTDYDARNCIDHDTACGA